MAPQANATYANLLNDIAILEGTYDIKQQSAYTGNLDDITKAEETNDLKQFKVKVNKLRIVIKRLMKLKNAKKTQGREPKALKDLEEIIQLGREQAE
jgi:hypothetical protein